MLARIYLNDWINKENELKINKLFIHERFYKIFLSKKYQEKNIFHQKVIQAIIEKILLKIKNKAHYNNNQVKNDKDTESQENKIE